MRVLIVSFHNLLSQVLTLINHDNIDIRAVITINNNAAENILFQHKISCPIYSYDYLHECIDNYFYDYVLVCGFEEVIVKDLKQLGVPKTKIIDLRMLHSPEILSLPKILKYYINTDIPYEIFFTGLSYTYYGTNIKSYKKPAINFSGISQDLYCDYKLMKHIFDRKKGYFKYGVIGIAPYSFHFDLSLSGESYRMLAYYSVFKETHNYFVNQELVRKIFNNIFLDMYEALQPPFEVNIEDRLNTRNINNHAITLPGYLNARKRAEEWRTKDFPHTVKENKMVFDNYINMCHSNNVIPLVVVFPVSDLYRRWFPKRILDEFYYTINQVKKKNEFTFLDYFNSDIFKHEDFHDVDHLNINGSIKMSELINSYILEMEKK